MPLCEEALSPILVPAKFLGIRTLKKSSTVLRAWGLTFISFFLVYTIEEAILRWHLIGNSSGKIESSNVIAATFDTVHDTYFVILVIAILHFNQRKSTELRDIFSVCTQVSANLNCNSTFFRKIKIKMTALSVFMNSALLLLYMGDTLTWSFSSNHFLHMFQSNIITATWITCEIVFLSIAYLTHQLFAQLNFKIKNYIRTGYNFGKETQHFQMLRWCYSELCQVISKTSNCFGPILFVTNLLKYYDVLISSYYLLLGVFNLEKNLEEVRYILFIVTGLFLAFFIFHTINFCNICDKAINEARSTSLALLKLEIATGNEMVKQECRIFRDELFHYKHINYSIFDLIKIDRDFISMFGVTASTNLITLMQVQLLVNSLQEYKST